MKKIIVAIVVLLITAGAVAFVVARNYNYHRNVTVLIQPFDDISPQQVKQVFNEVKLLHPNTILAAPIKLPPGSYYQPRGRYRADSIIKWLSARTPAGHTTIALTSKDISTTKGSVKDWGVMGLGYRPGNACVVSTYRLARKNQQDQFYKVCIHELGHTQGLPHCKNKTCYMRDAEGGNPLDNEHDFCPDCKSILLDCGWSLAN
ncbi:MAG: Zn-dependent protease [Bacteroidota bacterium]